MSDKNQNKNILIEGGKDALIAEIKQVSLTKKRFFALCDIQKESIVDLAKIPTLAGTEKQQLLTKLRGNVEKWLKNFDLLLTLDQNFLSAQHQKMLKLAAQFKINISAQKRVIPPNYLTLVNPYIEAFDRLDHRGIQVTMVVAAQDLQIVNDLRAMFVDFDALKEATRIFTNDVTISAADKIDLAKHRTNIMLPKIKIVENYFLMSNNPPANRLDATTQAATQQIATGVFDNLQQLEATPEANRTAEQTAQIKHLKKYQTELIDLVATTPFSIQEIDDINQPQGWVSTSADANRDLIINVNTAFGADEAARTKTHEMQHLLQVKNGRLVMSGADCLQPFYDIFDEIEAFQAECLVHGFHPSYPNWASVSTPQAIVAIDAQYDRLHQGAQITLETSFSAVENDNDSRAGRAWDILRNLISPRNSGLPPAIPVGQTDVSLREILNQWRTSHPTTFNPLNLKYF